MIDWLANLGTTFLLGLATPLTAVCVLPLYPGFIAFLTSQADTEGHGNVVRPPVSALRLGLLVLGGTVLFMTAVGLVFSTLLEVSLTAVVEAISPVGFALLALISILMIAGVRLERLVPQGLASRFPIASGSAPGRSALLLGLFFGVLVLPCNPGMIAVFFARALAESSAAFAGNLLSFVAFGVGLGTPLLVIAGLSEAGGRKLTRMLARHAGIISRITGLIMLAIAAYELIVVFDVV